MKEVPLPNGSDTAMDPITMDEPVDEPKEIDLNDDDDDMFKTMGKGINEAIIISLNTNKTFCLLTILHNSGHVMFII